MQLPIIMHMAQKYAVSRDNPWDGWGPFPWEEPPRQRVRDVPADACL